MKSELDILNAVRLEASEKGARLWRNNVGATYASDGRFIRYGLANDSEQLNKVLKSSDLIGIQPTLITEKHVGKIIGVFLCREIKHASWKFAPGNKRDAAQLAWINLINRLGGDADFATQIGTIKYP